jgi:hypothetical protein
MSKEKNGSTSSEGDGGLKMMMNHLGLREEDLDDVVFESEDQPRVKLHVRNPLKAAA